MENRRGLVVGSLVPHRHGQARGGAGLLDRHRPPGRRVTLGADRAYDVAAPGENLRGGRIKPPVSVNDRLPRPASAAARRSTVAPPGTPAKPKPGSEEPSVSMPPSRSRPPPAISYACQGPWPRPRHDSAEPRIVVGRWRIVEVDLQDRGHFDLYGSANLVIGANGHGEIAFSPMQAGLLIRLGSSCSSWI